MVKKIGPKTNLSAGWPEWVASKSGVDPAEFNTDLNEMFGILCFVAIALNFVAGGIVDFCRSRFATNERPETGSVIGFLLRT